VISRVSGGVVVDAGRIWVIIVHVDVAGVITIVRLAMAGYSEIRVNIRGSCVSFGVIVVSFAFVMAFFINVPRTRLYSPMGCTSVTRC